MESRNKAHVRARWLSRKMIKHTYLNDLLLAFKDCSRQWRLPAVVQGIGISTVVEKELD